MLILFELEVQRDFVVPLTFIARFVSYSVVCYNSVTYNFAVRYMETMDYRL
jgi:hypothetical protein